MKKTCSITDCPNVRHARGYCSTHAQRQAKYGDPLAPLPGRTYRPPAETLEARSTVDENGCRTWHGFIGPDGYGEIRYNNKGHRTHRLAWELANGPIPEGMYVDHMCHNRACLALAHLRLASPKQNQEHRLGANSRSVSGVRGVQWRPKTQDYCGYVIHNRKRYHAGIHKNLADAEASVIAKRIALYTHNLVDRMAA